MGQINPYLTFYGNCREAMTFYKDCLGGELTLQTVGDSPMANQWPVQAHQNILHASLSKNGQVMLLASDMGGPEEIINGNSISLSLNCSSETEIQTCFSTLASGGKVTRPLHAFFAGTIGTLTDKFGMQWLFYHHRNQNT